MSRLGDWWVNLRVEHLIALQLSLMVLLVMSCTLMVHYVEGWDWLDSVYFSVSSVTTVGYGDLVPHHPATKVFLIFYLPMGIAVGFTTLTTLGGTVIERERRRLERRQQRALAPSQETEDPQ